MEGERTLGIKNSHKHKFSYIVVMIFLKCIVRTFIKTLKTHIYFDPVFLSRTLRKCIRMSTKILLAMLKMTLIQVFSPKSLVT